MRTVPCWAVAEGSCAAISMWAPDNEGDAPFAVLAACCGTLHCTPSLLSPARAHMAVQHTYRRDLALPVVLAAVDPFGAACLLQAVLPACAPSCVHMVTPTFCTFLNYLVCRGMDWQAWDRASAEDVRVPHVGGGNSSVCACLCLCKSVYPAD